MDLLDLYKRVNESPCIFDFETLMKLYITHDCPYALMIYQSEDGIAIAKAGADLESLRLKLI